MPLAERIEQEPHARQSADAETPIVGVVTVTGGKDGEHTVFAQGRRARICPLSYRCADALILKAIGTSPKRDGLSGTDPDESARANLILDLSYSA